LGVPGSPGPPLGYAPDRPRCRVTSLTYPTTQPTHHTANPKPQPNRNKLCCLVIHVVYICLCVSLLPVFWRIKVFINPTTTRGGGRCLGWTNRGWSCSRRLQDVLPAVVVAEGRARHDYSRNPIGSLARPHVDDQVCTGNS